MPIGMSSGALSNSLGIWNPRAKGPLQFQVNNSMPSQQPMPMQNPMQNPMMRQPGGMMPSYPPIAPSRNLLNRHMTLPSPDTGAEVNNPMPVNAMPSMRRKPNMANGVIRRMF